jgi:hypothetical protein
MQRMLSPSQLLAFLVASAERSGNSYLVVVPEFRASG